VSGEELLSGSQISSFHLCPNMVEKMSYFSEVPFINANLIHEGRALT
jgi:hypothetical protein